MLSLIGRHEALRVRYLHVERGQPNRGIVWQPNGETIKSAIVGVKHFCARGKVELGIIMAASKSIRIKHIIIGVFCWQHGNLPKAVAK